MMAIKAEIIPLDERGLIYVREHLTGVNALCTALLEVVESEPSGVFTMAPAGADLEQVHQFTKGVLQSNRAFMRELADQGNILTPAETLRHEQAVWLKRVLRSADGSVCIIDDFNPRWSELSADADQSMFGVEDECYHLLSLADDDSIFTRTLAQSDTIWHGVAAICTLPPEIDDDRTASVAHIRQSAHSVLALTCTAYDGEGFVGWLRAPDV